MVRKGAHAHAHAPSHRGPLRIRLLVHQSSTKVLNESTGRNRTSAVAWREVAIKRRTASYCTCPINIPALPWRTDVTQISLSLSLFQPRLSSNITAPWTDSRRLRDCLAVQIKPDRPSQCEPANEGRPRDCSWPTSREAVPSRHTHHTTLLHTSHRPRLLLARLVYCACASVGEAAWPLNPGIHPCTTRSGTAPHASLLVRDMAMAFHHARTCRMNFCLLSHSSTALSPLPGPVQHGITLFSTRIGRCLPVPPLLPQSGASVCLLARHPPLW